MCNTSIYVNVNFALYQFAVVAVVSICAALKNIPFASHSAEKNKFFKIFFLTNTMKCLTDFFKF